MLFAALAATGISAACWWFGSGLHPLWWVTWLAPLPMLWLAPRVRAHQAVLAAFAAYAVGSFNIWTYLHTYIGLPMPVMAYAIGLPGLMLALCVWLFRRLLVRGRVLAAACAVPALWVAAEYINNLLSPHGTFFNIAYTQMDALAVIQIAAVTGIWGIGFLMLLLPAAVAAQAAPRATKRGRVMVIVSVSCVVVVVAFGSWRLQSPAGTTLRVGLVSLQKPVNPDLDGAAGQALETRYADAIERLANAGARTVLIPETSFTTANAIIPAFAELSKRHDLTVGAGIDFKGDPRGARNMLTVLQPGAASPVTYNKHHLLIGMDPFVPGDRPAMLEGSPRTGLAICKDMDFLDTGRTYAAEGAQWLMVPANDFIVDGWLHSRMAIMRGVENGFAMARAARNGRLTLSDDRGRVLAEASSERNDAELVGNLPLRQTRTLYSRWGDWFAWLDLAALLVLLGIAIVPSRHGREPDGKPPAAA
jgi:apolipoprotein N-acyltransferase